MEKKEKKSNFIHWPRDYTVQPGSRGSRHGANAIESARTCRLFLLRINHRHSPSRAQSLSTSQGGKNYKPPPKARKRQREAKQSDAKPINKIKNPYTWPSIAAASSPVGSDGRLFRDLRRCGATSPVGQANGCIDRGEGGEMEREYHKSSR